VPGEVGVHRRRGCIGRQIQGRQLRFRSNLLIARASSRTPLVNSGGRQLFFVAAATRHPDERIVMVIDVAGWHRSESLQPPENIYLLSLPPSAPELNPIEHVWDELREKFFHNRVFKSLDALEDHLALALKSLETDNTTVASIVSWSWIMGALLNSLMN